MTIEVSVVGIVVSDWPSTKHSVAQECDRRWLTTIPVGCRVSDLITHLGFPDKDIDTVFVNGTLAGKDALLREGDAVAFTGSVSGE